MGLVQLTAEGEVRQFLWNPVAAQVGLEGLGVTVRYGERKGSTGGEMEVVQNGGEDGEGKSGGNVKSNIALTWMGKLWRPA